MANWFTPEMAQELGKQLATAAHRPILGAMAAGALPLGAMIGSVAGGTSAARAGTIAPNMLRGAARGAGVAAGMPLGALGGVELAKLLAPSSNGAATAGGLLGAVAGGVGGHRLMRLLTGETEEERKAQKAARQSPAAFGAAVAWAASKDALDISNSLRGMGGPPSVLSPASASPSPAVPPRGPAAPSAGPSQPGMRLLPNYVPGGPPQTIQAAPTPPATVRPGGPPPAGSVGPKPSVVMKAAHIQWAETLAKRAAIGRPAAMASAAFDRMAKAAGSKAATAKKRASARPASTPRGS